MTKLSLLIAALCACAATAYGANHWQFEIIGHPNNKFSADETSNGRAIMIPLKNATSPDVLACEFDKVNEVIDDTSPKWTDVEPAGAKIHFVAGDTFAILDRNALDSDGAKIQIPTVDGPNPLYPDYSNEPYQKVLGVDVYVRVLGKPNTCMGIDAYAHDELQNLWFWAGSINLARKAGRPTSVNVNDLFDVWWCQVEEVLDLSTPDPTDTIEQCVEGTEFELSVFNQVFDDYFWAIENNGTRNVQVRLYPKTTL